MQSSAFLKTRPKVVRNCWLLCSLMLVALAWARPAAAQSDFSGPVPPIASGYGADGTNPVGIISIPSPLYPGNFVRIFFPTNYTSPRPTYFWSHNFGAQTPTNVMHLLNHIASRGNVAVFSPYNNGGNLSEQYDALFAGFLSAATNYPGLVDTNRVGFFGWSEGGGATPEMARRGIVERGWGTQGVFLFPMAPWFALQIQQAALTNDFKNAKLLMMVFSDDSINDHRMAVDIFNNMNMPLSEKDFMIVYPTTTPTYTYQTQHNMPSDFDFDAYDYYAVYRHLDALADYTFTGNLEAKMIALGNGSSQQTWMGSNAEVTLTPVRVTDTPIPIYPESNYTFGWSSLANPRRTMPMTGLTFSNWCNQHFVPAGQAGMTNDPDADGLANLLEYVTATDPVAASPGGGRITATLATVGTNVFPCVEFNRAPLSCAQIRLEKTTNLSAANAWENILYAMEVVGRIDIFTERVRLRATESWNGGPLFLRLRLDGIPPEK